MRTILTTTLLLLGALGCENPPEDPLKVPPVSLIGGKSGSAGEAGAAGQAGAGGDAGAGAGAAAAGSAGAGGTS